ncbi:arylsulfatase [Rubinisphaera italica]|uniref:Arylsulfatase n=1 Tax=Rubinisphaera italica TaxID=2527969 RepID=A0A5C5XME8_9PLAN|nr:arylsulfatase [Rubinisphaera italica]TWT64337.1 Arylsulfatase [Rubinisphaera italica]
MFTVFRKRSRIVSTQGGCFQSAPGNVIGKVTPLLIYVSVLIISNLIYTQSLLADPRSRPNIVLIMADDLGFADLGCYGSEIQTPYLDQLASNGLRFSQFYNTAKCHSSRVSLLTGLYCDQAGSEKLSRGATIAEALAPAGYSTAMVGKWHLSQQPTDFGFQKYWGHLSGATNFFTGDDTFRLNGENWDVPATINGRPFYTTHAIGDYAIQFVDEMTQSNDPFLLYVAFNAPHYPLQAPEEAVKKYNGLYNKGWDQLRKERHARQIESGLLPEKWKLSPRPEHVPAWDSLSVEEQEWEASRMEVFAAMVDVLDQNVGRLVDHLKAKGEFENTLFLFCSDNGACPFERTRGRNLKPWDPKSYWTYDASWAHAGNTPFRLYKQNQHEGGISSPLIVHWPAGLKTESGSITDQPGHLIDLMATFIDVGKADYPEQIGNRTIDPLQGKSLMPILQGEQREPHDELYFHFSSDRALRQGDWKLVSAKLGRWELYNMKDDRTELNDLSKVYPERVEQMATEWFRMAEEVDRLKGKQLAPVGTKIKSLDFRKDTSNQLKTKN